MTQDANQKRDCPHAGEPQRSSGDAALEALVRALARIAAEKDYAMQGGVPPPEIAPEPGGPS